jgi:nitroreductase
MDQRAETDYPVNDLIEQRWSPRSFSEEPVSEETLRSLFEAARWAPSSYNDQPWSFIVGTRSGNPETYEDIFDSLYEGNRAWADTAPVLGLSVLRKRFNHNGNKNRHALHDVGLAMGSLLMEATDRDLYVHQMAGFDTEKAREHFSIPETHEPVAAFALGYRGDPEALPEKFRENETAERTRNPLEEFVFSEEFESTSPIVNQEAN